MIITVVRSQVSTSKYKYYTSKDYVEAVGLDLLLSVSVMSNSVS